MAQASATAEGEALRGSARRAAGWALTGLAALTPLLAWLGPLGFAVLVGLVGLASLPVTRISLKDAPLAILLLLGLAWAAASSLWSPFRPQGAEDSVALKLALQVSLYWAAWQGARNADAAGRRRALRVLAWGLAAYGALLLVEAFTGGAIYQALRNALHDPIRPDLARRNIAHGGFVLALLWPVAAAAGTRAGAPAWLALPMAAGAGVLAQVFLSDAPVLSIGLALLAGGAAWVWPRMAPKLLGTGAALAILAMPLVVLGARLLGLRERLPESWEQRVGYWTYAVERIAEHPWRGWGLDASRTFAPHIQLHPHNGALQLWLELGAVGAGLAALVWASMFRRLARDGRSLVAAGAAASAAIYLLFGMVSFGVWQEWWLALGVFIAMIAAMAGDEADEAP